MRARRPLWRVPSIEFHRVARQSPLPAAKSTCRVDGSAAVRLYSPHVRAVVHAGPSAPTCHMSQRRAAATTV